MNHLANLGRVTVTQCNVILARLSPVSNKTIAGLMHEFKQVLRRRVRSDDERLPVS